MRMNEIDCLDLMRADEGTYLFICFHDCKEILAKYVLDPAGCGSLSPTPVADHSHPW